MRMEDMVLFSVDDHLIEPPDMFEGRMPQRFKDDAPKLTSLPTKAGHKIDVWRMGGQTIALQGSNAVAGRPKEEYGFEPTTMAQMRKGCYDVHARIDDMNANGIAASLNFGSFVGMAGQTLLQLKDKDLALAITQAWNDWHAEVWSAAYPGRLIPLAILPIWDADLAAKEVRRVAAKGVTAVSFPPNPAILGLPTFHNGEWDAVWKACVDANVITCLHFSDTSYAVPTADSPVDVLISNMPIGLYRTATDLVYSPILRQFPDLKFALSEGGVGWIPYFMSRIDFTYEHHHIWTRQDFGDKLPSQVFLEHCYTCFIDDLQGIKNRHDAGLRNMMWECDYPHADCVWPKSPESLWVGVKDLPDEEIDLISHQNAERAFRVDLFKHAKRSDLTVGALRAKSKHVDTNVLDTRGAGAPPTKRAGIVTVRDTNEQAAAAGFQTYD